MARLLKALEMPYIQLQKKAVLVFFYLLYASSVGASQGQAVTASRPAFSESILLKGVIKGSGSTPDWVILSDKSGNFEILNSKTRRNGLFLKYVTNDSATINVNTKDILLTFSKSSTKSSDPDHRVYRKQPSESSTAREKLVTQLGLQPITPGQADGYLVTENSRYLIEEYDMKPGDIIESANGYPLGDPAQDKLIFKVFKDTGTARISVRRQEIIYEVVYSPSNE